MSRHATALYLRGWACAHMSFVCINNLRAAHTLTSTFFSMEMLSVLLYSILIHINSPHKRQQIAAATYIHLEEWPFRQTTKQRKPTIHTIPYNHAPTLSVWFICLFGFALEFNK